MILRCKVIAIWLTLLGMSSPLGSVSGFCAEGGISVPELESAFIYQFPNYIEWPTATDKTADKKSFRILVIDDPALLEKLRILAGKKTILGNKVEILSEKPADENSKPQIVIIKSMDRSKARTELAALGGCKCLIITHSPGLASAGATINFFLEQDHLRFEINPAVAAREGLKINSKLLKLARIIE